MDNSTNDAKWGSLDDAARALGVSTRTIRRRIADGSISARRFGPKLIRVDMTRLEDFGRDMTWPTR